MDISTHAPDANQTVNKPILSRYTLLTLGTYSLVLALAAALRLALIDYFYPVLRNRDEFYRFLNTMRVRHDMPGIAEHWGVFTFNPNYSYEGFPPVQLWVHAPMQRLVEANVLFPLPPDYILWTRFLSAGISLFTTALIAWMGWYLARPMGRFAAWLAGFVAVLVWTVSPIVLHVGNLALIDPLLYPYLPLIIICTVYAVRADAPLGALAGLFFAICAIYTKYILVYTLSLPTVATAVLIWRRGTGANPLVRFLRGIVPMLPWLGVMAVISLVSMYWLVFEHNMFAMSNRETHVLYENGLQNALSPYRNYVNIMAIIMQTTGALSYFGVLALGVWGYRYSRRHDLPTFEGWIPAVLLPFLVIAFMMISSVVVNWESSRMRYPIAPMIGLLAIWALCFAQFVIAARHRWQLQLRPRLRTGALIVALLLPTIIPKMWENISTARAYTQRHIQQVVWEWSDATLEPPEGKIMSEGLAVEDWTKFVWDRTISGYTGETQFDFIHVPNAVEHTSPRNYWENHDIAYFFVSEYDLQQGGAAARAFVEELTLLKTFEPAPGSDYPAYFYRMVPPQHAADATFAGQIALIGYDLSAPTVSPGETITLHPFWQASSQPTEIYSMFAHLRPVGEPSNIVAQFDAPPAAETRLTPTWNDPDELIPGSEITLTVPEDTPPGDYELFIGLYDFQTGTRLLRADGTDGYTINLTVVD